MTDNARIYVDLTRVFNAPRELLYKAVDLNFTEVVENELLVGTEHWEGIPGQQGTWSSHRRLEFHRQDGGTRLVLREGPHPAGMAEGGRQAWESMFTKLDALLEGLAVS
jgi:uncharacterized protein YndB with AHSA1/START domain